MIRFYKILLKTIKHTFKEYKKDNKKQAKEFSLANLNLFTMKTQCFFMLPGRLLCQKIRFFAIGENWV